MPETLIERYALAPEAIEELSLARVEAAIGSQATRSAVERAVLLRMVYACGDPALAPLVRISPDAVTAGIDAIGAGRTIMTDVRMVEVAIDRRRAASFGVRIACAIDDPTVIDSARSRRVPRAVAAIDRLAPEADGGVVVIGNAPTALLALLDRFDAGLVRPALVIGIPVGFVAAAESKEELMRRAVPHITVAGTRGGSGLAAAAANALLRLAEQQRARNTSPL